MKLLEAAMALCDQLPESPALRIVFSFRDGTWVLVGKAAGMEMARRPVCVYPEEGTPEVVGIEGIPCDQAGNPLSDAKKVQRFMLADLLTGFALLEADPTALDRVQEVLTGQAQTPPAARRPGRREPDREKPAAHEEFDLLEPKGEKAVPREEIHLDEEDAEPPPRSEPARQ